MDWSPTIQQKYTKNAKITISLSKYVVKKFRKKKPKDLIISISSLADPIEGKIELKVLISRL